MCVILISRAYHSHASETLTAVGMSGLSQWEACFSMCQSGLFIQSKHNPFIDICLSTVIFPPICVVTGHSVLLSWCYWRKSNTASNYCKNAPLPSLPVQQHGRWCFINIVSTVVSRYEFWTQTKVLLWYQFPMKAHKTVTSQKSFKVVLPGVVQTFQLRSVDLRPISLKYQEDRSV